MSETRTSGEWIVVVDRFADFGRNVVDVRMARKLGQGAMEVYGPGFRTQVIPNNGSEEPSDPEMVWRIPTGVIGALCAALLDQDPTSERLTAKLEQLLDREAGRVDRLIELAQR